MKIVMSFPGDPCVGKIVAQEPTSHVKRFVLVSPDDRPLNALTVKDGNEVVAIDNLQSENAKYKFYSNHIKHFIKDFKLTVTNDGDKIGMKEFNGAWVDADDPEIDGAVVMTFKDGSDIYKPIIEGDKTLYVLRTKNKKAVAFIECDKSAITDVYLNHDDKETTIPKTVRQRLARFVAKHHMVVKTHGERIGWTNYTRTVISDGWYFIDPAERMTQKEVETLKGDVTICETPRHDDHFYYVVRKDEAVAVLVMLGDEVIDYASPANGPLDREHWKDVRQVVKHLELDPGFHAEKIGLIRAAHGTYIDMDRPAGTTAMKFEDAKVIRCDTEHAFLKGSWDDDRIVYVYRDTASKAVLVARKSDPKKLMLKCVTERDETMIANLSSFVKTKGFSVIDGGDLIGWTKYGTHYFASMGDAATKLPEDEMIALLVQQPGLYEYPPQESFEVAVGTDPAVEKIVVKAVVDQFKTKGCADDDWGVEVQFDDKVMAFALNALTPTAGLVSRDRFRAALKKSLCSLVDKVAEKTSRAGGAFATNERTHLFLAAIGYDKALPIDHKDTKLHYVERIDNIFASHGENGGLLLTPYTGTSFTKLPTMVGDFTPVMTMLRRINSMVKSEKLTKQDGKELIQQLKSHVEDILDAHLIIFTDQSIEDRFVKLCSVLGYDKSWVEKKAKSMTEKAEENLDAKSPKDFLDGDEVDDEDEVTYHNERKRRKDAETKLSDHVTSYKAVIASALKTLQTN